ncbi:MAG: cyclic nucleotide-binding domain-containing protein [Acidobacteriota bacterium]|nr:cyclic nucleotide-binding domain-containing protein [Acidobacteriota bacterium]
MADDVIFDALAASELFGGLAPKQLKAIQKAGREMSFPAGTELVVENDEAGRFFLIVEGKAEVMVGGETRATLGPGAAVGELALIDGGARSATVTAATDLRTFSLASWSFRPFLREPDVANAVIELLCRRLRSANAAASGPKT